MEIDPGWRGTASAVCRGVRTQWAVAAIVLGVALAERARDGRSIGLAVAISGAATALVVLGGAPRLRVTARRWPTLWRRSPLMVPCPGPWAGSSAATGDRVGGSETDQGLLHWRGRLLVMLDVGVVTPGRPLPVSARSLRPLLQTAGIVVEAIQWVRWVQDKSAAVAEPRSDEDLEPAGAGAPLSRSLLILRIDPLRNEWSIKARGGGDLGIQRLASATVTRAGALLAPYGLRPRPLGTGAALRAWSVLVGDVRGAAAGSRRRRAGPGRLERRRQLTGSAWSHRLLRWPEGGAEGAPSRRLWDVRYDDAIATRAGTSRTGHLVVSHWIRAGPGGVVAGGAVRLSARTGSDLDRLERDVRRRPGSEAADLQVALDDQWPSFVATLPLGGP